MGTVIWVGTAGDGDWTNTANWNTAAEPVSNDDVTINATADTIAGLSKAAVDLNSLYIGPNFKGTIGSAGTPLTIAVSGTTGATLTYASGGGNSFITAGTNGIDLCKVEHVTDSTFYITGGTYAQVGTGARCGPVELSGTATVTLLDHQSFSSAGVKVASGVTLTTLFHEGNYLESAADIGTGYLSGRLRMTGTAKAGTVIYVLPRGTYQKHSTGTDVRVRVSPYGTFSPEGSVAGNYTVTLMEQADNSNVTKDAPGVTGTFTTRTPLGSLQF